MKKINESPTVADTILFTLETHGPDGLLRAPAKINSLTINRVECGKGEPEVQTFVNTALEKNVKRLKREASANPCQENILRYRDAEHKLKSCAVEHLLTYREAVPVFTLNPAWEPTGEHPVKRTELEGVFEFSWSQQGLLQGDYTIQWTWTTPEDEIISAQTNFFLAADKRIITSQVARYTPPDKYEMLMNLYMPEMYQHKMKNTDLTPQVLKNLNWAVAQGFTMIEDSLNQLMDMVDPSLAHESMLPLLANFFNVRLKSDDTAKWRRQILRCVSLHKRKGTLSGLTEALDQAGISLLKITKLWQVVSQYKWTDGFVVKEDNAGEEGGTIIIGNVLGYLSRWPMNLENISVKIRSSENPKEYMDVPSSCIRLVPPLEPGETHLVIWDGMGHEPPIPLYVKDVVIINYDLRPMPEARRSLEDYLLSLPLMDQSEPEDHVYPPKNWNTRLIEDDDPMFDQLIQERQPFTEPVVFGKTRTTFLYSEKVYNMDTYDGSLRESLNPCDIGKEFMDECSYCQSSKFNADIEIEGLSESRVREAIEIIEEYAPFHAQLHFLNISGAINEFIMSPIETVESLATVVNQDKIKPMVTDELTDSAEISYVIEYADGTKEEGTV